MLPTTKCVAIVCFETDVRNAKLYAGLGHPVPRVVQYQVTIDPGRVSPSGDFIRFGMGGDGAGQGDEITGWIPTIEVAIQEVIAEWNGHEFVTVQHSAERAA